MINLDTTTPLTFLEWKQYQTDSAEASELSLSYNNYLIDWKDRKEEISNANTSYIKDIYKEFIKNINLSNLNVNVQDFLQNVDTDDIYELELAVHYYTNIIKDLLKTTRELRDEAKFIKTKNNLKISEAGIKLYLKNYLSKLLVNKEFVTENTKTESKDINNKIVANSVSIEIKPLATDNSILYESSEPNEDLVVNIRKKIQEENPNILQVLAVNKNGRPRKLKTNSYSKEVRNGYLGVNDIFEDWKRLPTRYYKDENIKLENLKFLFEKRFIEKYIANDLFVITGNKFSFDIAKVFKSKNPTANLFQRYGANISNKLTNLKYKQNYPSQLSFNNTGVTTFYSKDLSILVNLSAFNGGTYIIPDPSKYQPGVKIVGSVKDGDGNQIQNITVKQQAPLLFKAKNAEYKNNDIGSSVNMYNNKLLRNFGYQSRENSLQYSHTGINKSEDNINFWQGRDHLTWKNTDTYPVSVLNVYPESERLEDLLISNKTGIKLKSDVYGNEFLFLKSVYPKRKAGTSYISSDSSSSSTVTITAAEYYDGLYFDSVLTAISAAEYKASGTLYDSVTAMYDTFLHTSDTIKCEMDDPTDVGDSFSGPLVALGCTGIHNILNDLETNTYALDTAVHNSVINNLVDGGPFKEHPGKSSDLIKSYFVDTTIPYFDLDINNLSARDHLVSLSSYSLTEYESSSLNNFATSAVHLFDQQYISAGEVYVRDIVSQKVQPLSTAFVNIFNKHTSTTKTNILTSSNITDFDIIDSTIYIQTSAETLTELYTFEDGEFKIGASSKSLLT